MGSGASKEELASKQVLVIGGGYAGITAAAELLKAGIPFTLVDPKEYFHHCVAALRAAVCPEYVAKTAIPYKEAFGERFVQGSVVRLEVEGRKAVLETGQELEWTHCLVCVGSLGPSPGRSLQLTISALEEETKATADCIKRAEKIVIVGGGAVGFELAGEISAKYEAKEITIVSSGQKLVAPDFAPKFHTAVTCLLEAARVKVVVGRVNLSDVRTNSVEEQTLTVGETSLPCDLVLLATGHPPNTAQAARLLPPAAMDEQGRVKVDAYLRVPGCPGVFALGDVSATEEHKMAAHAGVHAETVVANLVLEAGGRPPKPYKQKFVGMLVPFGPAGGTGSMNGWTVPQFAVVRLKAGDLFTRQFWGVVGLKDKMPV